MNSLRTRALGTLAAHFLFVAPLSAQVGPAAANPQMRHFWHVFIAYAVAWVLIFGWIVSVARRFKRVEEKLGS
jgi:CcmD family protein